jgi:Ca2+-binding RTX toxin-like protein
MCSTARRALISWTGSAGDWIYGGEGNDVIDGDEGSDYIVRGGRGSSTWWTRRPVPIGRETTGQDLFVYARSGALTPGRGPMTGLIWDRS